MVSSRSVLLLITINPRCMGSIPGHFNPFTATLVTRRSLWRPLGHAPAQAFRHLRP